MPLFLQYLYVTGIFQGILLFALLALAAKNTDANRVLGTWCLFLALYFLGPFITLDGELNAFSSLIGWSYFLPASYGAFLYLYCRYAIVGQTFRWRDLWHFSPLLVCFLLNIDILVAAPEFKLHIVQQGAPSSIAYAASEFVEYSQAFIYFALSLVSIRSYQHKAQFTLSNFNPDIFAWLRTLLFLYFFIWFLKLVGRLVDDHSLLFMLADGLIVILIYGIAMAQWRNPKLFRIEQMETDKVESSASQLTHAENSVIDVAQHTSADQTGALSESIRYSLLKVVTQHMAVNKTFLDNQLTLSRLSQAVGISTHHLSEVLNQQEGENFYQFVNKYRINYICERFQQDQSIKILDLAMDAGFSSKSTFNAVFKKIKGMTPSQYRSNLHLH